MIKTIELSKYISVQGLIVSTLPGGEVEVLANGRKYVGRPIERPLQGATSDPTKV
ncbi:hypothetical protein KHP62_02940 [Rhodobacteraceae bacterium NNCM2]|nr:hypothetical protein [Coraliihabitans acroporae]